MSFDSGSIVTLIQTCQTLYDYYRDVKQSSVERRRLLDEVVSLQSALEALQKLVNVGDPASTEQLAQLLGPSQPFYAALQKTLADVETVLRNGVPKITAKRWNFYGDGCLLRFGGQRTRRRSKLCSATSSVRKVGF